MPIALSFSPLIRRPLFCFALLLCVLCCAMGLSTPAHAQIQLKLGSAAPSNSPDTVTTPRVQAQLVAWAPHGIAGGQPLELGLRITHQAGWHTYWQNPGDSGLPTQLNWQLPIGWSTTDIAWPAPQQLRVGDMLNYGYEGTVLLPVKVTVPADLDANHRSDVVLQLHASWLVCRVECIPEEGSFTLTLPAATPWTQWAQEFAHAHAQVPQALPRANGQVSVLDSGDRVTLQVQGLPPQAIGHELAFYPINPETFVHAAVLGQDWQQAWEGDTWSAQLPLHSMRGATPSHLDVILGLPAAGSDVAHAPPAQAWHVQATVNGQWQAADVASVSPALAAALAANAAASAPAPAIDRTGSNGWWMALVGGLLGGMLLNLMPCVFPVLAIKLMGFAHHGHNARMQRASGLAYAAGVVLSFAALGAVLLVLRAAGEQLGWGFQLQSPAVVATLAALFTLIGLNLAGMFELTNIVPQRVANLHARHPLADAFISGVVAVAIASPCTAPFMGASLGFAIDLPIAQALGVFVALGIGMALPYVLISGAPALMRWLPRPGAWMETFRRAMAFPMFATVVWLVWVLGQQSGIDGAATLLALLLCLAALAWSLTLHGRSRAVLSGLIVAFGAWLLYSTGHHVVTPAPLAQAPAAGWHNWSADTQAQFLRKGQPVFVDYTAAWCVTCQYNKRTTLADPTVLADFAQYNVALLRADWTRRDPAITAALTQLGRSGVPVYVLLAPGKPPVVLSEILSPADIRAALQTL